MAKAIKFANNTYLDDSGVTINNKQLKSSVENKLWEQNGHQELPGGLIIQWGNDYSAGISVNEYTKEVSFRNPFPNACLMVVACIDDPGYGGQILNNGLGILRWDTNKFRIVIKKNDLYGTISCYVRYIAIGY